MEIITSTSNQIVKRIVKLKQKKYREETGEYFVEGYKNVSDTCEIAPEAVKAVVLSESANSKFGEKFADFCVFVLADSVFSHISETESAQGVMCINAMKPQKFPAGDRLILLDSVRDPGNVGTILRSALAFGYGVVANNCADIYSPKVTRSSMSAISRCDIAFDVDVEALVKAGYTLVAADMGGESVFSFDKPSGKYCIVVGNEAQGIGDDVKRLCDKTVSVPMENMESLNAAVAASVLMCVLRYQSD